MSTSRVFRKASLDRLASPEQLDQVIEVTSPRGWMGLAAIAFLLVAGLTWSVVGSLAEKVGGSGILVRSGGVLEVVASAPGQVTDVAVSPSDSVTAGQVVARLAQPELFDQLQLLRDRLEAESEQFEEMVSYLQQNTRLEERTLGQRRANVERTLVADSASLRALAERIVAREQLVAQGLVTRSSLLATRQQYEDFLQRIRAGASQLAQLEVERLALHNRAGDQEQQGQLRIDQLAAEVQHLQRQFLNASEVVSTYTGRVLEVMTEQGNIVGRAQPILSLDRTGADVQDLVAVVYVPSIYGKMIQPGMRIQVSPFTVRQEEFGMMLGTVTFVSNFPATPRGMLRVLKNAQLVSELSGGGAPYEVHAELSIDPSTESGYRWTSSAGPPTKIESGTTALATVTVAEQRPISKVIPLLRRWSGTGS